MKKVLFSIAVAGTFIACNSNSDSTASTGGDTAAGTTTTAAEPAKVDVTQSADYQKGLEVVAKSDCATCHKINEKLVGPAYMDVSKKYAPAADTTIDRLAGKIINGGAGVWGAIPMSAHPSLSKEDATVAVKYVLLLKDAQ